MKTATIIKALPSWSGTAILYKVDPPMKYEEWAGHDSTTKYIVVSAVSNDFAIETYIFPANENGDTISMSEMRGSYQGGVSHAEALEDVDYEIKGTA